MKYKDVSDDWEDIPYRKPFDLQCCDCQLVHELTFRAILKGKKPQLQWRILRNERATAALRRNKKRK